MEATFLILTTKRLLIELRSCAVKLFVGQTGFAVLLFIAETKLHRNINWVISKLSIQNKYFLFKKILRNKAQIFLWTFMLLILYSIFPNICKMSTYFLGWENKWIKIYFPFVIIECDTMSMKMSNPLHQQKIIQQ